LLALTERHSRLFPRRRTILLPFKRLPIPIHISSIAARKLLQKLSDFNPIFPTLSYYADFDVFFSHCRILLVLPIDTNSSFIISFFANLHPVVKAADNDENVYEMLTTRIGINEKSFLFRGSK